MDQTRPDPSPPRDGPRIDISMPIPSAKPPNAALSSTPAAAEGSTKIRTFEQRLASKHDDKWDRTPNRTGAGATHVRSFHCKLTDEALHFLDQQINEWLDKNPDYEVKLVTSTVGEWTGKLKEPSLIVQVWV